MLPAESHNKIALEVQVYNWPRCACPVALTPDRSTQLDHQNWTSGTRTAELDQYNETKRHQTSATKPVQPDHRNQPGCGSLVALVRLHWTGSGRCNTNKVLTSSVGSRQPHNYFLCQGSWSQKVV